MGVMCASQMAFRDPPVGEYKIVKSRALCHSLMDV